MAFCRLGLVRFKNDSLKIKILELKLKFGKKGKELDSIFDFEF